MKFPHVVKFNDLKVTLLKYPGDCYSITAEGYGWTISYYYKADDWEPAYSAFLDRLAKLDVAPKPHPQNEGLFDDIDKPYN